QFIVRTKLTIGLFGDAAAAEYQPLFENLSRLFPVRFRSGSSPDDRGLDAAVLFTKSAGFKPEALPAGLPAFVAVENPSRRVTVTRPSVRFGNSAAVDSCLRDQTMDDLDLKEFSPLEPLPGHEVVAAMEDRPLWTRRANGKGAVDRVGVLPPAVGRNDYL